MEDLEDVVELDVVELDEVEELQNLEEEEEDVVSVGQEQEMSGGAPPLPVVDYEVPPPPLTGLYQAPGY